MLEWIIGAAIVGAIVVLARRGSSSDSSSSPAPAPGPETVFAADGEPSLECRAIVDKWVSALDADSQVIVNKALSEGDSTALEGFATVVDGANPVLADCIRAMKPKIVGMSPVLSAGDLLKAAKPTFVANPALVTSLATPTMRAALITCMTGMPADLRSHTLEVFDADPTRAKLSLIADALRPTYPVAAACIDKIPSESAFSGWGVDTA